MRRHRYVIFPTSDSREVTLTCPITPGPLSDQYTVEWMGTDRKDYNIKEDIDPSSSLQYQCIVSIQHRSDQENPTEYSNTITIETLGELSMIGRGKSEFWPSYNIVRTDNI